MPDKFHNRYRIPSNRLRGWDYAGSGHYYITIVTAGRDRLFGDIVNGEMILNEMGQIVYDEFSKSFEIRDELFLGEFVLMPDHLHAIVILDKSKCTDIGAMAHNGNVEMDGNNGTDGDVEMDGDVGMNGDVEMDGDVETHGRASLQYQNQYHYQNQYNGNVDDNSDYQNHHSTIPDNNYQNNHRQSISPQFQRKPKSISSFVAGFKSSTIKQIDDWIDANKLPMAKFNKNNPLWQSNYHDHIIRNETEYRRISDYIIHNPIKWKEDALNKK